MVNSLPHNPNFFQQPLMRRTFENIARNGENTGNQHFHFFPQCFQPLPKQIVIFQSHSFCRLQLLSI